MNSKVFEVFSLLSLTGHRECTKTQIQAVQSSCVLFIIKALMMTFQEATANIGSCSFHTYLYKTRVSCEIPFYQGLRLGLMTNCNNNFETLISCIKNVTRVCEHSWRSDAWIDMDVRLKFRKQFYCQNGALVLPLALCGKKYYEIGPQCVRNFHKKFRNDITDSTLCKEFSNAKSCIRKLFEEECPAKKNSHSLFMKVLFDGYNPFCKNIFYHPPTTATTPSRKTEEMGTNQPFKARKSSAGTNTVTVSSASREKLHSNSMFKVIIVSFYLLLM